MSGIKPGPKYTKKSVSIIGMSDITMEFSTDYLPLFSYLYIHNPSLPIFSSGVILSWNIFCHTKYFVLSYSIDKVSTPYKYGMSTTMAIWKADQAPNDTKIH